MMGSEDQVGSLAEQAYVRLRHEILTCILSPGQVVSERELARRYEVSKTPIREALTQVCHDGLVQRLPGRGYMVAPITIKDVRDLFDLRLILEVAAAERAARHPSPVQIAVLREMSDVSYCLDDLESHVLFLKANRSFHLALAEAAENGRLVETLEGLMIEMDRLFHLGLRLRDSSEEMRQEHQEVVAALESGDVEGTRDAIVRQIMTSRDRILEAIMQGEIRPVQVSG
jgi:DNA-binding GntR family transcriptional regulator